MIENCEGDIALTKGARQKLMERRRFYRDSASRLRSLETTGGRPGCSSTKGPLDE